MRTANLAIVFTDIKGFTERTSRQTHEENQRMLRIHDALLTPVFKAFGGRPIKTIGDAFLVVFDSPTQAVLCGVAIQDRLWDYNRRVPEAEQIHVRVAANMGEVRLEKGDVFGEPVNIAARVEGLADAGEVLFTEAVYLSMNKAEVPSEDYGQHELKGIPEKVRIYRVPRGGQYRLNSTQPMGAVTPEALAGGTSGVTPPYGGHALSRIQNLSAPEPANLQGSNELMTMLGAAASGISDIAQKVGGAGMGARLRALDLRKVAIGVGGLLFVALLFVLCGGDPIESMLDRKQLKEAEAKIEAMPDTAEKTFYYGRLQEVRGDLGGATTNYARAAKHGEKRGYKRLVKLTNADTCPQRSAAARALGALGDRDALGALKDLESSDWPDEKQAPKDTVGSMLGSLGLGGCNSKQAARNAIDRIEKGD